MAGTAVEGLLKAIRDIINKSAPAVDITRVYTLTGSPVALNAESAKQVSIINVTGSNVTLTINGGSSFILPNGSGATFSVNDADQITASGSGTLQYIVSN